MGAVSTPTDAELLALGRECWKARQIEVCERQSAYHLRGLNTLLQRNREITAPLDDIDLQAIRRIHAHAHGVLTAQESLTHLAQLQTHQTQAIGEASS